MARLPPHSVGDVARQVCADANRPTHEAAGSHGAERLGAMVRVSSAWKTYGDVAALRDVSCTVEPGMIMSLVGQNGAGKSTLISLIVGLQKPDRGTITVDGLNPFQWGIGARKLIGFAPQELAVYTGLTVRQNLAFYCDIYRYRGPRRREVLDRAISGLLLQGVLDRKVSLLSGGEKRRLHTAMALLAEAPLLVLDEPTVGADLASRARLLETVRSRAADGAAVVYSTHYLREIEIIGGNVTILHEGQVKATGTIADLIKKYGETRISITFLESVPDVLRRIGRCYDGRRIEILERNVDGDLLTSVFGRLGASGLRHIEKVVLEQPNFDDVFSYVTSERFGCLEVACDEYKDSSDRTT